MAKIFKKLFIGETVATSGTRVFKKLTTEEVTPEEPSLPIWNGTDLTGTTWFISDGWTAEAGYGEFPVCGSVATSNGDGTFSTAAFDKLFIGGSLPMFGDNMVADSDTLGYLGSTNTKGVIYGKSKFGDDSEMDTSLQLAFTSGDDVTNASLINWLLENGKLTSHTHVPVTAGLYDANDNLVASWDTLVNAYGMDVTNRYTASTYNTDTASPYFVLTNNNELSSGSKLIIPNSVSTIGEYAFYCCEGLASIDIPDSITTIGIFTFANCTNLASITIGGGVKLIDQYAFSGCDSLTSIIIPDGVTTIGWGGVQPL